MTGLVEPPAEAGMPSSDATEALVERLFTATIGTLEIASVHLGAQLGFYGALAAGGDATPGELATRTGTAERYAREWLEQQAVAGFLTVDDPDADAADRHYGLPDAHRPVLVDDEDLNYLTPLASLALGVCGPMDQLLDAYRTGRGVPFTAYGAGLVEAIGAINRPQYVNLVADWLAAVPEVDARLRAQPPARVADLACGTAWSSISIARAYPTVLVDAIDEDTESISRAGANVAAAGLTDRVRPVLRDAGDPRPDGRYDLVTIFEALHDMNHPVEALRTARASLAPGGSLVIADERVAERFAPPGDELERFNYGWSILHCLAVGLLDEDSAGTGTVIRPDTIRVLRHRRRLRPSRRAAHRARVLALLPARTLTEDCLMATAHPLVVDTEALRASVRVKYREVAARPDGEFHFHTGRALAALLGYDRDLVDTLPDRAVESFAGVADPLALRPLAAGERVVDLGSGAGFDCFVAARRVGPGGRVVGIDMTPEMLDKASATARKLGLDNVEFRRGIVEDVPVDDGWADVVMSNGVLNLVADKRAAMREIVRVLRPGGALAFADITVGRAVPEQALCSIELWTDCIAGGQSLDAWQELMRDARLVDLEVGPAVDTFGGARGEKSARAYDVVAHAFLARRPA